MNDVKLRRQLLKTMDGGEAHLDFESGISDFPAGKAGLRPRGAPRTGWQLLEHMRIAQWDILEFSRDSQHKSPKWPEEYWPATDTPPEAASWENSVAQFKADAAALRALTEDASADLFKPIEGGDGQTLLREAMLVATHNSYHLGQLVFLKKMLEHTDGPPGKTNG